MLIRYIDKIIKLVCITVAIKLSWIVTLIKFFMNGVKFKYNFVAKGVPIINVNLLGKFSIGSNLEINSGTYYNMIGRQQRCYFVIGRNAELVIGDNVGLSGTAIVCWSKVTIGNNVRIGGGVVIYDTDFHSTNLYDRLSVPEIVNKIKVAPIEIEDGAFIGAHSIILKGVKIGENSVIGAGSVVTKSIPKNQIWAGNPIKFVKEIDFLTK
jgi:acetyltransferase-like isoleucine patch superfamily enzyme